MAEDRIIMMAAGEYADLETARADYRRVKDLHEAGQIGRYDATVVTKTPEGKVKIVDTYESGTQRGAVGGAIVGGLLGLVFPPSMIASAAAGAILGGGGGHLFTGLPKGELERIGNTLQSGEAGLVVVAEAEPGSMLEQVLERASRRMSREVSEDIEDFNQVETDSKMRV